LANTNNTNKTRKTTSNRTHTPASGYKIEDLRRKEAKELVKIASGLGVDNPQELKRQDVIFEILKAQVSKGGYILFTGILEIKADRSGFLRSVDGNFSNSCNDAYVSQTQISRFAIRGGDIVTGQVRPPKDQERYYALLKIEAINYMPPEDNKKRLLFDNLVPIYPQDILTLEYKQDRLTGRILDIFTPIGKGQRALIVAPPRSGKTEILKEIAHGIEANHSDIELMVLLVDERPEEVTDMQRSVKGEVYGSTFDLPAKNHIRVAELVIEKAKRRVELGKDVVILLDSITRLARAYNTATPSSGKVLSGGVDANALQKPKRFFGAARNLENGGSLTIIATALIETGSKMDEVIFEEFKGTGNSELVLSREVANRRVYPAISIAKSGTRKEEILLSKDVLNKSLIIRNAMLDDRNEVESLKKLYNFIKQRENNEEFLNTMQDMPTSRGK